MIFFHPMSSGLRGGRTEPEFRHKTLKIGSLHIFNESFPRWCYNMQVWERRMTLPILLTPDKQPCMGHVCAVLYAIAACRNEASSLINDFL